MLSHLQWLLLRISRKVWVRATAFSVLGIAVALLALVVKRSIPEDFATTIGADAVDSLLNVLATSMLSVTIFSLSTMVSAYGSATSNVTPRATQLLLEDSTAQNALATFLGSFLYSLVGIIVLQTGLYGASGRVVLFVATLGVIVFVVVTLLRWTDYVLSLGRVRSTTEKVETAARHAMKLRGEAPTLGAQRLDERMLSHGPENAAQVNARQFAYVQHVDIEALETLAHEHDLRVFVDALPGHWVDRGTPLCHLRGRACEPHLEERAREAFTLGDSRSFDQDPRFGMCVLSEIASRALSPALNDPGTAIDVLTRGARLLAMWAPRAEEKEAEEKPVRYGRVYVAPLALDSLFDDFFVPIARDGASLVEVCVHIQKGLEGLARLGGPYPAIAARHARSALARTELAMRLPEDVERVRRAATKVLSEAARSEAAEGARPSAEST